MTPAAKQAKVKRLYARIAYLQESQVHYPHRAQQLQRAIDGLAKQVATLQTSLASEAQ